MAPEEQVLVEIAHWVARVLQYGADHPACRALGEKTHATLTRALLEGSPLVYGVLKEDMVVGETRFSHPIVRTRLAPHLHERGILVLRFASGVTTRELTDFVACITATPQSIFERGGLVRLLMERGVVRVEVDELEHEVTVEEREAQKRRARLRDFLQEMLRNLLAQRTIDVSIGEELRTLLAHPSLAVTLLEEEPVGLAEATAGLALVVRQEEFRTSEDLAPRLRQVILALSPPSRARMLLGFPALIGDFRIALSWAFEGFSEDELARIALPALRARPGDLDVVLYALAAAVPRDLRRRAALRRAAVSLFDLPDDEPSRQLLASLAQPFGDYESFAEDHETLRTQAARTIATRRMGGRESVPPGSAGPNSESKRPPAGFDGARAMKQAIRAAAKIGALDRVCRTLPAAATALSRAGEHEGIVGIVLGLQAVAPTDTKGVAAAALHAIGTSSATAMLLDGIDGASAALSGEQLDELMSAVKLLVGHSPAMALERLESSDSRKLRRLLLDGLATCGAELRPHLESRLRSPSWFVVRNAVLLLARAGCTARDLVPVLAHPHEKVRLEVARALRVITADELAMEMSARLIVDPSHEVRDVALGALRGEHIGARVVPLLASFAGDEHQPEELRRRVIALLGDSSREEAASALFDLLQPRGLLDRGDASALRERAAAALQASRAPNAPKLFSDGLQSPIARVRKACERVLGRGA